MPRKRQLTKKETEETKKRLLDNLLKSFGVVYPACKASGISTALYYKWRRDDPEFLKKVNLVQEDSIDFVESQLMKNIHEGDKVSILFYLKCKAKHRGYIEQQNVNINSKQKIEFTFGEKKTEEPE